MKKFSKKWLSLVLAAVLVLGAAPLVGLGLLPKAQAAVFQTQPMISAGAGHNLVLKSDGTVWAARVC